MPWPILHNSPWHCEITALCRQWLYTLVALDETNDTRADFRMIGDQFFIR